MSVMCLAFFSSRCSSKQQRVWRRRGQVCKEVHCRHELPIGVVINTILDVKRLFAVLRMDLVKKQRLLAE